MSSSNDGNIDISTDTDTNTGGDIKNIRNIINRSSPIANRNININYLEKNLNTITHQLHENDSIRISNKYDDILLIYHTIVIVVLLLLFIFIVHIVLNV